MTNPTTVQLEILILFILILYKDIKITLIYSPFPESRFPLDWQGDSIQIITWMLLSQV